MSGRRDPLQSGKKNTYYIMLVGDLYYHCFKALLSDSFETLSSRFTSFRIAWFTTPTVSLPFLQYGSFQVQPLGHSRWLSLSHSGLCDTTGDLGGKALNAEDIVPQEYIDKMLAYYEAEKHVKARADWRNAKRALHELQKRVPTNSLCDEDDIWVSQLCTSDISAQAYEDECQTPDGDEYTEPGHCDPNTTCQNLDTSKGTDPATGEEIIEEDVLCVPSTPTKQDVVDRTRQYGIRRVTADTSKTQVISIPVLVDNTSAGVSARIISKHCRLFEK